MFILWNIEQYTIFAVRLGLVAQLNSAPDYGSGGYRFESCRGHNIKKGRLLRPFFIAPPSSLVPTDFNINFGVVFNM